MDRQAFLELIDKWMNGNASETEVQALMNYYYSFKEATEWDEALLGAKAQLGAEMEQQLLQNIRRVPQQEEPLIEKPVRRIPWGAMAAAVLLAVLVSLGWLFRDGWHQPPARQLELVTTAGEHRQLTLPDGTQVWLSPSSSLQYPDKFNGHTRELSLRGEAFFSVAQQKAQPFIIHSGQVDTKVLGTSFTIQAYDRQPEIGVTVLTGKVAVMPAAKEGPAAVAVSSNQRAIFSKESGQLRTAAADASELLLRRQGVLKYHGAALPDVVHELEYYYNVTINIEGSTADCFYFGEFNTNSQLEKALHQLCLTLNATLVKEGNTWIIRKGRC